MATVSRVEPNKTATGNRPQLLNVIEEMDALCYAANTFWIAQEKMDGVRQMIFRKLDGTLGASNKLGFETPGDRKVMADFAKVQAPFLMDGELVGETFYAFDVLELGGRSTKQLPYEQRYQMLETFLATFQHPNVVLVPSYRGDRTIIQTMKAQGAEGVVFKRASAAYSAGRPNSGGDQFKFKFVNTASFIVVNQNGTKRSVSLGLFDGVWGANQVQLPAFVGSCTIPANHAIPAEGTIVEVRYLYAYRGGSIFQPCYLGVRNDILAIECQMKQLRYKGEAE